MNATTGADRPKFLHSFAGILTALAAILTASVTIWGLMVQLGERPDSGGGDNVALALTESSEESERGRESGSDQGRDSEAQEYTVDEWTSDANRVCNSAVQLKRQLSEQLVPYYHPNEVGELVLSAEGLDRLFIAAVAGGNKIVTGLESLSAPSGNAAARTREMVQLYRQVVDHLESFSAAIQQGNETAAFEAMTASIEVEKRARGIAYELNVLSCVDAFEPPEAS
jgi:hypothetical protein